MRLTSEVCPENSRTWFAPRTKFGARDYFFEVEEYS